MSKTSGVTIHYDKNGETFDRSFSGFDFSTIGTKEQANAKFVSKYSSIVDGTATTYDFTITEKGIEAI